MILTVQIEMLDCEASEVEDPEQDWVVQENGVRKIMVDQAWLDPYVSKDDDIFYAFPLVKVEDAVDVDEPKSGAICSMCGHSFHEHYADGGCPGTITTPG